MSTRVVAERTEFVLDFHDKLNLSAMRTREWVGGEVCMRITITPEHMIPLWKEKHAYAKEIADDATDSGVVVEEKKRKRKRRRRICCIILTASRLSRPRSLAK